MRRFKALGWIGMWIVIVVSGTLARDDGPDVIRTRTSGGYIYSFRFGDQYTSYRLDGRALGRTPAWEPMKGTEPPLSVSKAVRLSTAELARHVDDPAGWEVAEVEIEEVEEFERWIYLVRFRPVGERRETRITVPVLMSGRVLERMDPAGASD